MVAATRRSGNGALRYNIRIELPAVATTFCAATPAGARRRGLADNLLTIGTYACILRVRGMRGHVHPQGESWKRECCVKGYELRFKPADQRGTSFETTVF